MTIYFEYLSLIRLVKILYSKSSSDKLKVYYIDISKICHIMLKIINQFLNMEIHQLVFEMRHIKDKHGELIRTRIPREDLFYLQEDIKKSEIYRSLNNLDWNKERFIRYLDKGIIPVDRDDLNSAFKKSYIIQVVSWHMRDYQIIKATLYITGKAWFNIYSKYALKYGIQLKILNKRITKKLVKSFILNIIRNNTRLFFFMKKIQSSIIAQKSNQSIIQTNDSIISKIYVEGRGDANLKNNGYSSDLFWYLNSSFPSKNIIYKVQTKKEEIDFKKHGIHIVKNNLTYNNNSIYKIPYPNKNKNHKYEERLIKNIVDSYNITKESWAKFFQLHNIKIFLSWFKYDNSHIAIADAIKMCDGISVVNQIAFDGVRSFDCATFTDLYFGFSKFSYEIDKSLYSQVPYFVITGYPKDYAVQYLKNKARKLRKRLQSYGAQKIIFAIDENSGDDSRWHTGHKLQQENYAYVLEEVLRTSWLGVIFKPKTIKTLRRRLGDVNHLLERALKTGRCYIFEESGRHTTLAPPLLAGLASDICIHGHLSAGTAALECALAGKRTLLIDREGSPFSKLHELKDNNVIFYDWPNALEAVMDHFNSKVGSSDFGVWNNEFLNEMDPFRDGKSALRIGTYLKWLIEGFEQGINRETIMANAAERYAKEWGEDKILSL